MFFMFGLFVDIGEKMIDKRSTFRLIRARD